MVLILVPDVLEGFREEKFFRKLVFVPQKLRTKRVKPKVNVDFSGHEFPRKFRHKTLISKCLTQFFLEMLGEHPLENKNLGGKPEE